MNVVDIINQLSYGLIISTIKLAVLEFDVQHQYQITVQPIDASGTPHSEGALGFAVTNHDDLIQVLNKTLDRAAVPDEEAAEFIVGLKLLTEVALRHRKEALFKEFFPHLSAFMMRLKALPTKAIV